MENEEFGSILKKLRIQKGLSITDLAEKSGVSRPYLSQIEHGKKGVPSIKIINDLAPYLDIDNIELAHLAGYYTAIELQERRKIENYYNSMSEEEIAAQTDAQIEAYEIEEYRKENYPDLKEIIKGKRFLYFEEYELSNDDKILVYKILNALFENKEKNYPSAETIEKEYCDYRKEMDNIINRENWTNSEKK